MFQYFQINTKETEALVISPEKPRLKDYHEIMWIQEGKADFIIDGDRFHVASNAFFVIPKDRYHQFLPQEGIKGQVVRFSEDFLDYFPRILFSKFNHLSRVVINTYDNTSFTWLYNLIAQESPSYKQNPMILTNLLRALIHKLDDVKRQQYPECPTIISSLDILDQFQVLMDTHISEKRSVSFYAEKLNITPRKLGEATKSIMNNTTENLIAKRLLIEAKRQLSYTNKTVSEVAYDLSFKDNSYFTKYFKKQTQLTPKQFRSENAPVK